MLVVDAPIISAGRRNLSAPNTLWWKSSAVNRRSPVAHGEPEQLVHGQSFRPVATAQSRSFFDLGEFLEKAEGIGTWPDWRKTAKRAIV